MESEPNVEEPTLEQMRAAREQEKLERMYLQWREETHAYVLRAIETEAAAEEEEEAEQEEAMAGGA